MHENGIVLYEDSGCWKKVYISQSMSDRLSSAEIPGLHNMMFCRHNVSHIMCASYLNR